MGEFPPMERFTNELVGRLRVNAAFMMQMDATRKDIQNVVDEIIYSDF